MPITFLRRLDLCPRLSKTSDEMIIELAASMVLAMPATMPPASLARVRTLSGAARFLLDDAIARSPTIARLIAELRAYDVIVYVDVESMSEARGSTSIFGASPAIRLLRIVISNRLDPRTQIEVLGHELHHAIEIARAAEVVDDQSLRTLFQRIGYRAGPRSFETDAARRVEQEIRRDLARQLPVASNRG